MEKTDSRYSAYVQILKEELLPAMGCTEPIAIAYAAAKAAAVLGTTPGRLLVEVSGNIIKNVKSVVVPHTGGLRGIPAAAAAGAAAGDADAELEVISNVTPEQIEEINAFLEKAPIEVKHVNNGHIFDIIVTAFAGDESACVRIIDYHTSQLEPSDIKHILCGEKSDKLPAVIQADKDDNVLVFWSGHGVPGQMVWLEREEGFTTQLAKETFEAMHQGQKYRKLLCLTEACYSGSVMSATEGIPGILAITAANPYETSKADIYNTDLHVWMTNRFTATLHDCIIEAPGIPLRDLYYRLFINTVGSHVTLYNVNGYGNIYQESMKEFLK